MTWSKYAPRGRAMRQQILEIAGHRLAAIVALEGRAGTPVVFIHGITASVDFWPATLPAAVRDSIPWVSLSLPAHYPSRLPAAVRPADITEEMFAELHAGAISQLAGGQRVALVGWSTGGFSALNLAARRPEIVASVLSISGFAKGSWRGLIGHMQCLLRLGRFGRRAFEQIWTQLARRRWLFDRCLALAAANRQAFWNSPLTRPALDSWQYALAHHNLPELAVLFERLGDLDIRDDLARISAPTLIVGGDRDPFIPIEHTRFLAGQIPGARLHVLENTGHMYFSECTEEYFRLLQAWLAERAGGAANASAALAAVSE